MSISAVLCTVQVADGVLCRMRVLSSEGMIMFCGVAEQKDGYEAFYEQTGQDDTCRSTDEGIDAVSSMARHRNRDPACHWRARYGFSCHVRCSSISKPEESFEIKFVKKLTVEPPATADLISVQLQFIIPLAILYSLRRSWAY